MELAKAKKEAIPRYIEDLPEPLIHQILAFLPTIDATKFSILSKPLRSAWLSFPILDFDFADFSSKAGDSNTASKSFFSFIEKSFEVRSSDIKPCLKKLRFCYNSMRRMTDQLTIDDFISVLENLVNFALQNNVEDLDLDIGHAYSAEFLKRNHSFDQRVFSLKSINALKLKGFILGFQDLNLTCPSVEFFNIDSCTSLKNIRVLSSCRRLREVIFRDCRGLEKIQVQAQNLESFSYSGSIEEHLFYENPYFNVHLPPFAEDFIPLLQFGLAGYVHVNVPDQCEIDISACQLLRNLSLENSLISDELYQLVDGLELLNFLHLVYCNTPTNLEIRNPELRTLIIHSCSHLQSLVILSRQLESFEYHSPYHRSCVIDVLACDSLTSLELVGASISDSWVKDTVSALCCLEKLVLDSCNVLQEIEFENDRLSTFELKHCSKLKRAEIGARNLIRLSYSGKIGNCSLLILSTKCHPKISFNEDLHSHMWFENLRTFLVSFGHCQSLTLACSSAEGLIFPEEFISDKLSPLHDLKHVIVELNKWPRTRALVQLVESLLWLVPRPKTMTFVSGSRHSTLQIQSSQLVKRKDVKICCLSHPIKCWRHGVDKVVVENFEEMDRSGLDNFFAANM